MPKSELSQGYPACIDLFNIYGWTGFYKHNILYQKDVKKKIPIGYNHMLSVCMMLSLIWNGRLKVSTPLKPADNDIQLVQWHIPRIGHQIGPQNQLLLNSQEGQDLWQTCDDFKFLKCLSNFWKFTFHAFPGSFCVIKQFI